MPELRVWRRDTRAIPCDSCCPIATLWRSWLGPLPTPLRCRWSRWRASNKNSSHWTPACLATTTSSQRWRCSDRAVVIICSTRRSYPLPHVSCCMNLAIMSGAFMTSPWISARSKRWRGWRSEDVSLPGPWNFRWADSVAQQLDRRVGYLPPNHGSEEQSALSANAGSETPARLPNHIARVVPGKVLTASSADEQACRHAEGFSPSSRDGRPGDRLCAGPAAAPGFQPWSRAYSESHRFGGVVSLNPGDCRGPRWAHRRNGFALYLHDARRTVRPRRGGRRR